MKVADKDSRLFKGLRAWLKTYHPALSFEGFAKPGDITPPATSNHTYMVTADGTIFGQTVIEGQILVGNGSSFDVRDIKNVNLDSYIAEKEKYLGLTQSNRLIGNYYNSINQNENPSYKFLPADTSLGTTKYAKELFSYAALIVSIDQMLSGQGIRPAAIKTVGFDGTNYSIEFFLKYSISGYTDFTGWSFVVVRSHPFQLIGEKVTASYNGETIEAELFAIIDWDKIKTTYNSTNINTGQIEVGTGYGEIKDKDNSDNLYKFIHNTSSLSVVCSVSSYNGKSLVCYGQYQQKSLQLAIDNVPVLTIPLYYSNIGLQVAVTGDTLHILSEMDQYISASERRRGIEYRQVNLITKAIADYGIIEDGTDKVGVSKPVIHGSDLFCAVYYKSTYDPSNEYYQSPYGRSSLYKLVGTTFTKVTDIVLSSEIWGEHFIGEELNERFSFYEVCNPIYTELTTDGALLYAAISTVTGQGGGAYFILVKKSTDNGATWQQSHIEPYFKSIKANPILYSGNLYYIFDPILTVSGAIRENNLSFLRSKEYLQYPIIDSYETNIHSYDVHTDDENVYVLVRGAKTGEDNKIMLSLYKFELGQLAGKTRLHKKNYLGKLKPTYNPISLVEGDYVRGEGVGEYGNLLKYKYPYLSSSPEYKQELRIGEIADFIFTGKNWGKDILADSEKAIFRSLPFEHNAERNDFQSRTFRIPVIDISVSGTLLACADIRYTSAADYDIIDIGFCRSLDNGRTWSDYQKILVRQGSQHRLHDPGMVIDRHQSSATYGRIYVFGKVFPVNKDSLNYSIAELKQMKFYMTYSDDDGLTWSEQQDVTSLFPTDFITVSTGCSAGITMSDGTLILPVYYSNDTDPSAKSAFLYKTTSGNWTLGDRVSVNSNENSIIQLDNGNLLMNARPGSGQTGRLVFELTNIGQGWNRRTDLEVLQDVIGGCNASLVKYQGTYLFSQPTTYGSSNRGGITVFQSSNLGDWRKLVQLTEIDDYTGGYSSLICDDNYFGILYEAPNSDLVFADLSYLKHLI